MSARVCVCVRVSDGGRAELCASACAGASVRRSVRPALCPALRARSFAGPPNQMRLSCGVVGAAAGWVRHPPTPAPPRLREGSRRSPGIAQGQRGWRAGDWKLLQRSGLEWVRVADQQSLTKIAGAPSPNSSWSPRKHRPRAEVAWPGRAGEPQHRIRFIHDFFLPGAPGPGGAATATARGIPAGRCAPNPTQDRQADRWGYGKARQKGQSWGGKVAWRGCRGAPRVMLS